MVLRRGCRGCFVSVLCVTSAPSDRVRPRAVMQKNKQAAQPVSFHSHCSPVSYVVRADVCGRFLTRTCFTTAHEELRQDAKGALLRTLQRAGGQENIYTVC